MDNLLSSPVALAVAIVAAILLLVYLWKALQGTLKLVATLVCVALIGLGSMLLLDRFSWMFRWPYWLRFGNLWPLILVAIGVALLMRSREERA